MRISDWSSDVCSSDLAQHVVAIRQPLASRILQLLRRRRAVAREPGLPAVRTTEIGLAFGQQAGLARDTLQRAHEGGDRRRTQPRHFRFRRPLGQQLVQLLTDDLLDPADVAARSEEHTSELQSLMRNSYAVFC